MMNSNTDPYWLRAADSFLGESVPDCAGPDTIGVPSTSQPQTSHQNRSRQYLLFDATVSNDDPSQIRPLEQASSSMSILPSVHAAQEQDKQGQRSPKYPRYSNYDARIASYATFREFRNLDTKEMARTGLFYTAKADEVQCFQCGIELRNWKPDKDPLSEHIKESPDCLFLADLLGVKALNKYKEGATGGTSVPVLTTSDHIKSPQYQIYHVRLSTFTRWPPSMTQKPEQVAQAGFYYTGAQDVVICFVCDGCLTKWDPADDPWIEHARWFPQCSFVKMVKGQEFIDLVRRMTKSEEEENDPPFWHPPYLEQLQLRTDSDEPSQLDTYAAQIVIQTGYSRSAVAIAIDVLISKGKREYTAQDIMAVILEKEDSDSELPRIPSQSFSCILSLNDDTETLRRQNEYLKSIVTCIKCNVRQRNILFLPCTHHCLCQFCAENCSLCRICYRIIKHKIETRMV